MPLLGAIITFQYIAEVPYTYSLCCQNRIKTMLGGMMAPQNVPLLLSRR